MTPSTEEIAGRLDEASKALLYPPETQDLLRLAAERLRKQDSEIASLKTTVVDAYAKLNAADLAWAAAESRSSALEEALRPFAEAYGRALDACGGETLDVPTVRAMFDDVWIKDFAGAYKALFLLEREGGK